MFDGIYQLPIAQLAALTAVVFVGAYWAGCIVLRPILRMFVRYRGSENAIIGTVLSAFGVLYGLLLSLIAVAAYQNLSEVQTEAAAEASALLALYRDASEFPDPPRVELRTKLADYGKLITDKEWPELRQGIIPLGSGPRLASIRAGILDLNVTSRREELIQAEAIKHFEQLSDHGRKRRYAAQAGIPAVMWYVVIVGTVINFGLMWMFEMRFVTQLLLGGALAFFLGALILLIAVLERPYRSVEFGVSSDPYDMVNQVIERDQRPAEIGGKSKEK